MKALYISLLIFLLPINMFAQWENLSIISDSNFVPLSVGNVWQYLKTIYDSDGSSYSLVYISVANDTIIEDKIYYEMTDFSDLIRYSQSEKKLYIRWEDSDYVHIDFNLTDGTPYQSFIEGQYRSVLAEAGEDSIFNLNRAYGGFLQIESWLYKVLYTDSIGMSYHSQTTGPRGYGRYLIEAIIYDSSGYTKHFTNHYKPTFELTPLTIVSTPEFNLSFKVKHRFTKILIDPLPWQSGLDFIDSVTMYSYYSRNDSVISNSPITPMHSSDPVNVDYLVSIQIDTVLMKDGFAYNYRFFAEDKGIIPEYSNSPDSGYYQCVWDETTGIEDGNNFLFNLSLNQNYPNPFNPTTSIQYAISSPQFVTIKVYDILGKEVATLVNEEKPAGNYEVEFSVANLPSGMYFYRIQAGTYINTKKMVLLR